jgi:hypothetical protein
MADDNQEEHRTSGGGSGGGSDTWNEINELTLSVMANRTKYDKCKKSLESTSDALHEAFQKEKMYYKDRIIKMTRGLFHERCENEEINRAHQEYLKSCIEYLKWNDITDMIGDDIRNEVRSDDGCDDENDDDDNDDNENDDNDDDNDDDENDELPTQSHNSESLYNSNQHKELLSIANKMCIRRKTIDDFIVLKPTDEHIKARLPKIRDYHGEIMKRASKSDYRD